MLSDPSSHRVPARMVQGAMFHVGKSVMTAALCRILVWRGYSVAPFKAQNMSLNSYVTRDGGEIGRAQTVQAEAARLAPTVDMNPILLKPDGERRSEVVVLGRATSATPAQAYYERRRSLWSVVTDALDRLRFSFDVVVIEGAGSPVRDRCRYSSQRTIR